MEITRKQVLSEYLVALEGMKRAHSRSLSGAVGAQKLEDMFTGYELRCEVVRKMIQDIEAGEALTEKPERKPAKWQIEQMEKDRKAAARGEMPSYCGGLGRAACETCEAFCPYR